MSHPAPKLVKLYLARECNFDTEDELLHFIEVKITQVGASPSMLAYMVGCTYAEARSMLKWYERQAAGERSLDKR